MKPLQKYISSPQTSDDEFEIEPCFKLKLKLLNLSIKKRKDKRILLIDTLVDYITANSSTKKKFKIQTEIEETEREIYILMVKKKHIIQIILEGL
tara:strand:- start:825 stop:1109 length:285 start_codon:yes stop_codon:yes gene_type:complete